jgi:hypothetical protein
MMLFRFHVSGARFRSFPACFPALRGKRGASFPFRFLAVSIAYPSFPISCLYTGNGKRSPFHGQNCNENET